MTITRTSGASALALAAMLGAAATAFGQETGEMPQGPDYGTAQQMPGMMAHGMGHGMMGPGMMGQMGPGMGQGGGPGMMGPGMGQGYGPGPGMMAPGMGQGFGPGPGMMGQRGPGMGHGFGPGPGMGWGMGQGFGPGPGMMGQMAPGMGPGMMSQRFGPGPGMMGHGMHRFRVVPTMELSTDDVRRFLERHISVHGLQHLEVGEVTQTDDQTITADIVTREGSLALRLEIDPYTGFVKSMS